MTRLSNRVLLWTPRTLGFVYVAFLFGLVALEAFGEGHGFWGDLLAFTMHAIPMFILAAGLILAWRWEWIGTVIFGAGGTAYVFFALSRPWPPAMKLICILMIAGPAFAVAALFLANWLKRGELHVHKELVHAQTARSQAAWHVILQVGGGLYFAVALILAGVVIPLVVKDTSYRLQWGTIGPTGYIVYAIPHVILAALIFYRNRGGRFPVLPGAFGLIMAFLLVLPASSYLHGPVMRLAAIALFACAGIDVVVGALSLAAAALRSDSAEGNLNRINSGGFYKSIIGTLAALGVLVTFFAIRTLQSAQQSKQSYSDSLIYPSSSQPFGMTYGEWQAAYWRYVVSIPSSINPLVDTTGANCNVAQPSGPVFFLHSALLGSWVTRTCTVPASKALLVNIAGTECSNIQSPPSYGGNEQDMRTCAASMMDGVGIKTLRVTVDEMTVPGLQHMRSQSPYFNFTMPATDNLLRLDGVTAGSSVTDAYTVMLKPLSSGNHVIHIEGAFVSERFARGSFGATYYLKVQ